MVEDLPLAPKRGGRSAPVGVDDPEAADKVDCLRTTDGPGEPNGAFVSAVVECEGDGSGESLTLFVVSKRTP